MDLRTPRYLTECALVVAVATSVWWKPPWWAYVAPVAVLVSPHIRHTGVAFFAAISAIAAVAVAIWAVATRNDGESAIIIFALLAVASTPPHADCIWTAAANRG